MEYWRGFMNWPIDPNWKCEVCGEHSNLTWGLVHAECRCNRCHAVYTMRDSKDEIVTIPISRIKDEWKKPAQHGYEKFKTPLSEFTSEHWDQVL